MALRARKVSGAFEKRPPGPLEPEMSALSTRPPRRWERTDNKFVQKGILRFKEKNLY